MHLYHSFGSGGRARGGRSTGGGGVRLGGGGVAGVGPGWWSWGGGGGVRAKDLKGYDFQVAGDMIAE